ncbi:hypothetical protein M422DRAFT_260275, partial [Sphaerobolus stellatus SS14]
MRVVKPRRVPDALHVSIPFNTLHNCLWQYMKATKILAGIGRKQRRAPQRDDLFTPPTANLKVIQVPYCMPSQQSNNTQDETTTPKCSWTNGSSGPYNADLWMAPDSTSTSSTTARAQIASGSTPRAQNASSQTPTPGKLCSVFDWDTLTGQGVFPGSLATTVPDTNSPEIPTSTYPMEDISSSAEATGVRTVTV